MNHIKEQIEREAEKYSNGKLRPSYVKDSFIAGANFALEMDRWVKVEDGLPEDKQEVLACYTWGEHTHMNVLYYKGREWYYDDATLISKVTHWQPLPKLPK